MCICGIAVAPNAATSRPFKIVCASDHMISELVLNYHYAQGLSEKSRRADRRRRPEKHDTGQAREDQWYSDVIKNL